MKRKLQGGFMSLIGFILSPASWWNDLFVNFPLSYLFALPFGLIQHKLFLPSFIFFYWLSNVLGILLMHFGIKNIKNKSENIDRRKELRTSIIWGIFYTLVIILLVVTGVLKIPEELIRRVN